MINFNFVRRLLSKLHKLGLYTVVRSDKALHTLETVQNKQGAPCSVIVVTDGHADSWLRQANV
jgi:hypothetical protein